MGLKKAENQVRILLADTILALCRNTLPFHAEISVEGLLGITLDSEEIFLVNINQTIKNDLSPKISSRKRSLNSRKKDASDSDDSSSDSSDSDQEHRSKRRRRRNKKKKKIKEEKITSDENSVNACAVSIPDEGTPNDTERTPNVQQEIDGPDRPGSVSSQDDHSSSNALLIKPETMEDIAELDEEENGDDGIVKDESCVLGELQEHEEDDYADADESYQTEEALADALQSEVAFQQTVISAEGLENCIPQTTIADSSISAFSQQGSYLGRMSEQAAAGGSISAAQLAEEAKRQGNKACPLCGKQFHMQCDLVRHLRVHTGERPHPCPVCQKWFRTTGNLRSHLRTHLSRGEIRL